MLVLMRRTSKIELINTSSGLVETSYRLFERKDEMRPTTSNPKRRHTLSSPTHQQQDTPRSLAETDVKTSQSLRLPLAFEDVSAEVLWSAEPTVPQNILARPHTSNPRYVELNQRDTPRRETAGNIAPASAPSTSGAATSSSPQLTPSDNSPDQRQQHASANDGSGVLWACESESIDPALIARPITANPWLRRLFESGTIPEANWSNKGAQILWSSIDVEDWRMLARPHASNPLLERVVGDASQQSETTPIVAHKVSEVLWHRDAEAAPRNTHSTQKHPVVLVDANESNAADEVRGPVMSESDNPVVLAALRTQTEKIQALESKVTELSNVVLELSLLIRRSVVSQQNSQQRPPVSNDHQVVPPPPNCAQAYDVNPTNHHKPSGTDISLLTKEDENTSFRTQDGTARSELLTYLADPSPLSVTIPQVKPEYPPYHAPSPPRVVAHDAAPSLPSPVRHVHYQQGVSSGADLDADTFVVEDDSAIEPGLEGIDDAPCGSRKPSRTGPSHTSAPNSAHNFRPESAQLRPTTASASGASRVVHQLRDTVDATRPQSAPLNSYRRTGAGRSPMDGGSTTTFSKDGSNALLLNNKAIADQYQKMIRAGHPFALKSDFVDMYRQKSEAFGMPVTNREIERKLKSFSSVGREYLSFEEFSILYLHIAQW